MHGIPEWLNWRRDFLSINRFYANQLLPNQWNISIEYMRMLKSFIQLTRLHIDGVHPIFGGPMSHNLISDYLQAWFCLHTYYNCCLVFTQRLRARTHYHCAYFSLGMYINNVFDSLCILNYLAAVKKIVARQNRHRNEIKSIWRVNMKADIEVFAEWALYGMQCSDP